MIEIANFINENETTIKSLEQLTFLLRHTQQKLFRKQYFNEFEFWIYENPLYIFRVLLILRSAATLYKPLLWGDIP